MTKTLTLFLTAFLLVGCVQTIAIRTMGGIMEDGLEAFNEEADLELAKDALGSNLKLVETLIKGDPDTDGIPISLAEQQTRLVKRKE